jgi:hypothetical protein
MKKTVAVDFDGVIHAYSRGWQDGSVYDPPVPYALDALRNLRKRYTVVIYTTRAREDINEPGGAEQIREWFKLYEAEDLADLEITDKKPLAIALIDDRAIRFKNWAQAIPDLQDFDNPGNIEKVGDKEK